MRINKALNLVLPIELDDGGMTYVHSTPVSREVFTQYFLPMSKAFAAIFGQGLGAIAGPRIAYLMLEKTSEDMGVWKGPSGVYNGLVNEMIRLSNVMLPDEKGWKSLPLQIVIDKGMLNPDEVAETLGTICFFILCSAINKKDQIEGIMEAVGGLWGSAITSLNSTEYMNSLSISIKEETTGEMATTSSLPS